MSTTVDEQAARIHHYVVATAIGSAKGLFGKDLTVEEKVYSMTVPADYEGKRRLCPSPSHETSN